MKKTIVITGANSGLGYECARRIAEIKDDYRIVMACRSPERAETAKKRMISETGSRDIVTMPLDLASLSSVRSFAEQLKAMNQPIYGLVCNAGISGAHTGTTADGMDCIFQSNHLGHFLLTLLLLPLMQEDGRIISVSSDMHCPPQGELTWLGTEAIAHPDADFGQNHVRYSYSKLCNLYFIHELSERLKAKGSGITANAFNPGLMVDTNFAPDKSRFTPAMLAAVSDRIGSLDLSSKALAELVTGPEYAGEQGNFYDRSTNAVKSSPLSYNKENAAELWEQSMLLAGMSGSEYMI